MLPAQRLLLLGRSGLVSAATSVLGTTPLHYWDFTTDRALFAGKDVGGVTSTPGWSFTRASTGYAQDVAGNLISFGSGVLRRTNKGALIEGAGTNLVLRSQEFGDAAWAVAGLNAVTSDVIAAPDGTTTADKITENSATSSHYHRPAANITISNATAYTFSIYAKAAERRYVWVLGDAEGGLIGATPAVFDLQAGTVINAGSTTASIQALAGGWYRLIVTATSTGVTARPGIGLRATSGSGVESYAGDGASGCYIWGAQLE